MAFGMDFGPLTFFFWPFFLVMFLAGIALFLFWIWMIVDVATRKFKSDTDKVVWILIVLLLNILGALIYFFVIYLQKRR